MSTRPSGVGSMTTTPIFARAPEALVAGARVRLDKDADRVVERAVSHASAAMDALRRLSSADRAEILDLVADACAAGEEPLAASVASESGYLTRRDMLLEVRRCSEVFRIAAAVARTGIDEVVNLEAIPRARGALGLVKRVPHGPLLAISAFNGPMLIAAHKVAPAIVCGNPVVLKPSPRVPEAALRLGELILDAGWPRDALSVLPVSDELTMRLVRDPRLPVVSFTGGAFGWQIKDAVPRKHVHLELGGVGALVVAADADLERAADDCVAGGFVRSGQACLSVQRIYVEAEVFERFAEMLAERVWRLRRGPRARRTDPLRWAPRRRDRRPHRCRRGG
jgi:acyl-CoA reductase-like NAD-dependent aldehyde dehydrogenase